MKKIIIILLIFINSNFGFSQCTQTIGLYTTDITYNSALANWAPMSNIDHYKIRYKIYGTSTWSNLGNIGGIDSTRYLPLLQQNTTYEWEIISFCDSTNQIPSLWSIKDTFTTTSFVQCTQPTGINTTNINFDGALANWTPMSNTDHYTIHYRIYGTSTWNNLGNIGGIDSTRYLPLLQQNTTYEWEIISFCDSTSQIPSLWSIMDTFTTTSFVASIFDPIITNSIGNTICNTTTNLTLFVSQSINEPDIGTSTITSDGGSFNIQSLSMGDSVGYAIMNTSTQIVLLTLKAGIIAGQNYAIVNSYDSTGVLIGFFSIENVNGGIKVSSTSPNDGNNYTSGFTSEINFNNVFINPNINGPLSFYTDIESELNDQFNDTTTTIINCINPISENSTVNNLSFEIYDFLGRKTKYKENTALIYKYSNGEIRKIITLIK